MTRIHLADMGRFAKRLNPVSQKDSQSAELTVALRELYDLLENYAPRWYTRAHHKMAASGLRKGGRASTDVFIVLHDLLEGYAPVWYTEKHHKQAELVMRHLKAMDARPAKKRLSN